MAQRHFFQLALSPLLLPVSWVYACAMYFRKKLYDFKILKSYKSPIMTICLGNISWGGTGKSPLTDYLLKKIKASHKKAVVLTRGYGKEIKNYPLLLNQAILKQASQEEITLFPDEALMLTKKHPEVNILIDPKRSRAAKTINICEPHPIHSTQTAQENRAHTDNINERASQTNAQSDKKSLCADFLLMDDGFQHFALHRNYDFLLLDKDDLRPQNPLGFLWEKKQNWNRVIPLGSWREGSRALHRAHIFLLKCPKNEWGFLRKNALTKLAPYQKPLFLFQIVLEGLQDIFAPSSEHLKNEHPLAHTLMHAFTKTNKEAYSIMCGVGNPRQVQESIESFMGRRAESTLFFADHHDFSKEKDKIISILEKTPLICTEKDAVKLAQIKELKDAKNKIYQTNTRLEFYHSEFYLNNSQNSSCSKATSHISSNSRIDISKNSHFDQWLKDNCML